MSEIKGIPPELVKEMTRLGVTPGDHFFLLVNMLASTGRSLEDVVRDVGLAIETLRLDSRETVNVIIGGIESVIDHSQDRVRILFHGGDGVVGVLDLINQSANASTKAAGVAVECADMVETAVVKIENLVGRVDARERKSFWVLSLAFGLMFGLVFGALALSVAYRLEQVVMTRNAPEIARAFAEASAHHPLPDSLRSDSIESEQLDAAYEEGIARMPPQLALFLRSVLVDPKYASPAEWGALKRENERLRGELANRADTQTVRLTDGSWSVRIAADPPSYFHLQAHEGTYARVYSPSAR